MHGKGVARRHAHGAIGLVREGLADIGFVLLGSVEVDFLDPWGAVRIAKVMPSIEFKLVRFFRPVDRTCAANAHEHVVVEFSAEINGAARARRGTGRARRGQKPMESRYR